MDNEEQTEETSFEEFLICDLITIISKSYKNYLMYKLTDLNITPGQIPFILELMRSKKASQDDLAKKLFLTRGTAAKTLRKLDDEKIIERKTAANNRRKYDVYLTDKGKETALEIEKIDKSWDKMVLAHLKEFEDFKGKEEIITLLKNLAKSSMMIFAQEKGEFKDFNGSDGNFGMHPFSELCFRGHHFKGPGSRGDFFRTKRHFKKDSRKKS